MNATRIWFTKKNSTEMFRKPSSLFEIFMAAEQLGVHETWLLWILLLTSIGNNSPKTCLLNCLWYYNIISALFVSESLAFVMQMSNLTFLTNCLWCKWVKVIKFGWMGVMCFGFLTNLFTECTVHVCIMFTHLKLRSKWLVEMTYSLFTVRYMC